MRLVMRISHRIAVLDAGRLIAQGDPPAIQNDPAVIEAYLGAPSVPAVSLLAVDALDAGYGDFKALHGVSFAVDPARS